MYPEGAYGGSNFKPPLKVRIFLNVKFLNRFLCFVKQNRRNLAGMCITSVDEPFISSTLPEKWVTGQFTDKTTRTVKSLTSQLAKTSDFKFAVNKRYICDLR